MVTLKPDFIAASADNRDICKRITKRTVFKSLVFYNHLSIQKFFFVAPHHSNVASISTNHTINTFNFGSAYYFSFPRKATNYSSSIVFRVYSELCLMLDSRGPFQAVEKKNILYFCCFTFRWISFMIWVETHIMEVFRGNMDQTPTVVTIAIYWDHPNFMFFQNLKLLFQFVMRYWMIHLKELSVEMWLAHPLLCMWTTILFNHIQSMVVVNEFYWWTSIVTDIRPWNLLIFRISQYLGFSIVAVFLVIWAQSQNNFKITT